MSNNLLKYCDAQDYTSARLSHKRHFNYSQLQTTYRIQTESNYSTRHQQCQLPSERKPLKYSQASIFFDFKPQSPKMTSYQIYLQQLMSSKKLQQKRKLQLSFVKQFNEFPSSPSKHSHGTKKTIRERIDCKQLMRKLGPKAEELKKSFGELEPWDTSQERLG